MRLPSFRQFVLPFLVLLEAAACTPNFSPVGLPGQSEQPPRTAQERMQRAHSLWERSFRQAGTDREDLQLRAVELLLTPDTKAQGQAYLGQIIEERLNTAQLRARRDIDRAALALLDGRPEETLRLLPPVETVPRSQGLRILEWRSQALALTGSAKQSLDLRMMLAANLTEREAIADNETEVWKTLTAANANDIYQWAAETSDPTYRGWLALAYIQKSTSDPQERAQRLREWEQRYPNHPARARFASEFSGTPSAGPGSTAPGTGPSPFDQPPGTETYPPNAIPNGGWTPGSLHPPHRIAVLLPQNGSYANVAQAILAGLFTAYYQDGGEGQGIQLRVYDAADQAGAIRSQYDRAVSEGADFIIGPLAKETVAELVRSGPLTVPALSLNYLDERTPGAPNLFQFGLLPEDEARQVAERAAQDGRRRALVFYPAGEWGERLKQAFSQRYAELGGTTAAAASYPAEASDYSPQIRAALMLDQSDAREKQLQRIVGRDIKFQPARRRDIDMIFMAAAPRQAQLLAPQFKFYFADDLPIYATSHIYSGQEDPVGDRDLNGIIYCDIPWLMSPDADGQALRERLMHQYPDAARQYPRLAALGADAYRIAGRLGMLAQQGQRFEGVTGSLSLGQDGRIHRELRWAQFKDGRPALVGASSVPVPQLDQDQDAVEPESQGTP